MIFYVVRWSKLLVMAGCILLIFSTLARLPALAQESFGSRALPDAPNPPRLLLHPEQTSHIRRVKGACPGRYWIRMETCCRVRA
jgi:hypothetical protein